MTIYEINLTPTGRITVMQKEKPEPSDETLFKLEETLYTIKTDEIREALRRIDKGNFKEFTLHLEFNLFNGVSFGEAAYSINTPELPLAEGLQGDILRGFRQTIANALPAYNLKVIRHGKVEKCMHFFDIAIKESSSLKAADKIVALKYLLQELVSSNGMFISFMPYINKQLPQPNTYLELNKDIKGLKQKFGAIAAYLFQDTVSYKRGIMPPSNRKIYFSMVGNPYAMMYGLEMAMQKEIEPQPVPPTLDIAIQYVKEPEMFVDYLKAELIKLDSTVSVEEIKSYLLR